MEPLTWERMKYADPTLAALETAITEIGAVADASPTFCATEHWLGWAKPILLAHVGWGRGYPAKADAASVDLDEERTSTGGELLDEHREGYSAPHDVERWLRSSQAYDRAYDALHDLLPDCGHDGDCHQ